MRKHFRNGSPELFLAAGVAVNIVIAFAATRLPAFGLSGFAELALILIASDVVLYLLAKTGLISSRSRDQ